MKKYNPDFAQKFLSASAALLAVACMSAIGQGSHAVEVSSNVFTPSGLTINVGDTVVWTNVGGSHNVNGTQAAYPSNPESFGNSVGSGWVYSFTFTTPGTYDYHCDPHVSFGMTGQVIVEDVGTWIQPEAAADWNIFPNPVRDRLTIRASSPMESVSVYAATGQLVSDHELVNAKELRISMESEKPGLYLVTVRGSDGSISTRPFVKE